MELFTELTVREHLVLARRVKEGRERLLGIARDLSGFGERPGPGEDEAVADILALLGLDAVADRPALSIPLGTGRLLEVARALASEPTVMLLDEPSSGLDVHETEQLGDALRRVREDRGTAFVLVEHNVEFVLGLSDRVTVLDFGRVLVEGSPEEIRTSPEVQAAYFGAPLEDRTGADDGPKGATREHRPAPARVTDLEVAYGEARALFGVSFDVREGSVTTVLGANGAGQVVAGGGDRGRRASLARAGSSSTGEDITGTLRAHDLQARARLRPRVAQPVPAPLGEGQPVGSAAVLAAARAAQGRLRPRARDVPGARRTAEPGGGHAVGRRAADVRAWRACWRRRPRSSSPTRCRSASRPLMVDLVFESLAKARDEGITVLLIEQFVERALGFADDAVVLRHGLVGWQGHAADAGDELLAEYLGGETASSL